MNSSAGVPILMYHSVGVPKTDWIWSFLTVPYTVFEDQIAYLKRKGYRTVSLSQVYRNLLNDETVPEKALCLTFDDGYLDNWVFAYPILKKYGFTGTIFVNPEFVDPCQEPRVTIEEVWRGEISFSELELHGFLSWEEMRQMGRSGVMDIQSHAMTHTWFFKSDKIIDFRHPGDEYVWMEWNANPSSKYKYMAAGLNSGKRLGEPVYEHRKALSGKIFFPSADVADHMIPFVRDRGGVEFFEAPNWRETLEREAARLTAKLPSKGRMESDEEYKARLEYELKNSKEIIEKELGKKVNFLAWPGGGYSEEAVVLSREFYLSSTLSSREKPYRKNRFRDDPARMKRVGIPVLQHKGKTQYFGGRYLFYYLQEFTGSRTARAVRQALKLFALLKAVLAK